MHAVHGPVVLAITGCPAAGLVEVAIKTRRAPASLTGGRAERLKPMAQVVMGLLTTLSNMQRRKPPARASAHSLSGTSTESMGAPSGAVSKRQTGPAADSPVSRLWAVTDQNRLAPWAQRSEGTYAGSPTRATSGALPSATCAESELARTSYSRTPALASVPFQRSETNGDSPEAPAAGPGTAGRRTLTVVNCQK